MGPHVGVTWQVITPSETRKRICEDLALLEGKRHKRAWRKHGNIPL